MILHSLHDYYRRKAAHPDPAEHLPAFGLEEKEIPFVFELTCAGGLVAIKDTRGTGKKPVATRYLVPQGEKKTSGIAANLLWDNAEYVLALPDPKKLAQAQDKGKAAEYLARLQEMHAAFVARLTALPPEAQADDGVRAVLAFLRADPAAAAQAHAAWAEISASNPIVSFRLEGDDDLVCQRPAAADGASAEDGADAPDATSATAICLLTGERGPPERLHTAIKGVWGAQTSGANIVSFNLDAFNSFGKTQGANAPVSRGAAFAYTTALNHLLDRGSRQRIQVGDASTVFWAQRSDDADVERWFLETFGDTDDPDARTELIRALYTSIHSGRFDGAASEHRFYVLGLAPNAARIAVRFWHAASVAEIGQRIRAWFDDLRIVRGPNDPEFPKLRRLLAATAVLGKLDNVPPGLNGDLMRAILDGTPLPAALLHTTLQRCRADQARKTDTGTPVPNVGYHRAALLKAWVNRWIKRRPSSGKEITVALDPTNTDAAYLAGRLFAAYERVQSDAAGRELNRTIRDTYFGTAMSNPAMVFPRLIELNQHHLRDLKRTKPGLHVTRDRLIGEIWNQLPPGQPFPVNQPVVERARFALGYYHQRQAFFTKAEAGTDAPADAPDTEDTPLTEGAN